MQKKYSKRTGIIFGMLGVFMILFYYYRIGVQNLGSIAFDNLFSIIMGVIFMVYGIYMYKKAEK